MKFANGNSKLGTGCFVVSRPVGDTCPTSCQFLNNGCYAQATEKRFPNARTVGMTNLITDKNKIRALILESIKKKKSLRLHERGDFGINNDIDWDYVNNWVWACESVLIGGVGLPSIWTYTHFYNKDLYTKLSPYMALYASVHNSEDKKKAEEAGFKFFAWCDTDNKFGSGSSASPKTVIIDGNKYVTCPEMRRGRDKITCAGSKNTLTCNLCIKGLANVLFLEH